MLKPDSRNAIPFRQAVHGPLRSLVNVAIVAGVRRAKDGRKVGPRHTNAVVAPSIDAHIGSGWHVTLDTSRAG